MTKTIKVSVVSILLVLSFLVTSPMYVFAGMGYAYNSIYEQKARDRIARANKVLFSKSIIIYDEGGEAISSYNFDVNIDLKKNKAVVIGSKYDIPNGDIYDTETHELLYEVKFVENLKTGKYNSSLTKQLKELEDEDLDTGYMTELYEDLTNFKTREDILKTMYIDKMTSNFSNVMGEMSNEYPGYIEYYFKDIDDEDEPYIFDVADDKEAKDEYQIVGGVLYVHRKSKLPTDIALTIINVAKREKLRFSVHDIKFKK